MYIEVEKIRCNSEDYRQCKCCEWEMLEKIVIKEERGEEYNKEIVYIYFSILLGCIYEEIVDVCQCFLSVLDVNSVFYIIYWLGKFVIEEVMDEGDWEISFFFVFCEKIGYYYYGDFWV